MPCVYHDTCWSILPRPHGDRRQVLRVCDGVVWRSRHCRYHCARLSENISAEARCPARRVLVNAREWRNNSSWSGVAYTTSGSKARSNARWRGRSLTFKTRWRMCFSGFRTSRSPSFVFMKTFSLFFFFFFLLTDRTRTAVKMIYLLISVQFIFFHALWMVIFLSFYFS